MSGLCLYRFFWEFLFYFLGCFVGIGLFCDGSLGDFFEVFVFSGFLSGFYSFFIFCFWLSCFLGTVVVGRGGV